MKRIIFTAALTVFGLSAAFAQDEFDALRFAKSDIVGTARYMGMAGAFNSLGGDPTAMITNPAGLGLYRRSELSFTANLAVNATKADYDLFSETERWTRLNVNNFSYITAIPYYTGTKEESWGVFGISFNRKANFNRKFVTAKNNVPTNETVAQLIENNANDIVNSNGSFENSIDNIWDDPALSWLSVMGYESNLLIPSESGDESYNINLLDGAADSEMIYSERGYVNEWAFSYSHNFDNKFYLGVTLGIEDMEYERDSYYMERYFAEGDQLPYGILWLNNYHLTTGSGFNIKVGGILRATNNLRFALAFHSPTWYSMNTQYYGSLQTRFSEEEDGFARPENRSGDPTYISHSYKYRTPYKILAGASYIGTKGIISLDYELTDYNSMRLHESGGVEGLFESANYFMGQNLKATHTFKVGGEYRVTNNIFLRGGFANVSRSTEKGVEYGLLSDDTRTDPEFLVDRGTQYVSLGWGYRTGSFSFDMAYLLRSNKADFYTSGIDFIPQEIRTNTHNIVATIGFRF